MDLDPELAFTVTPSREAEVAPVMAHCKVDDWPEVIILGLAVKLVMTGALEDSTVTVAVPVTEPLLLVAVSV